MSLPSDVSQEEEVVKEISTEETSLPADDLSEVSSSNILAPPPPPKNPNDYFYKYYFYYPHNGRCVEVRHPQAVTQRPTLLHFQGQVQNSYVYTPGSVPVVHPFSSPSTVTPGVLQSSQPSSTQHPQHVKAEENVATVGYSEREVRERSVQRADSSTDKAVSSAADSTGSKSAVVIQCKWKKCLMKFETREMLVRHVHSVHLNLSRNDKITCKWLSCPRYKGRFKSTYLLRLHMRKHTGEQPHVCPVSSYGRVLAGQMMHRSFSYYQFVVNCIPQPPFHHICHIHHSLHQYPPFHHQIFIKKFPKGDGERHSWRKPGGGGRGGSCISLY